MLVKFCENFLKTLQILILLLIFSPGICRSDDSPGFFLKITKNIPRLGKRYDKLINYNEILSALETNINNRRTNINDMNNKFVSNI